MTTPTEEKLTDEQAEAMLKMLSRHFHQPVMPIDRYCKGLNQWARAVGERAANLRKELFPNLYDYGEKDETGQRQKTPLAKEQQDEYDRVASIEKVRNMLPGGLKLLAPELAREVMKVFPSQPSPREHEIRHLLDFETDAHQVERTFLAIRKSNLLARLLYAGEKLRKQACPDHKGTWSGIEWGPDNACPHKCQLTGWVQEPEDKGKPLPGVQVVKSVDVDGVTIIIGQDGEELGKAAV